MKPLAFDISSPVVIVPLMMLCFYAAFLDIHFDHASSRIAKPYMGPIIHTPDEMIMASQCVDWLCKPEGARNADR